MSDVRTPAGQSAWRMAREAPEAAPLRSSLGRLLGAHTTEWAWRQGAKGEEMVGAELAWLPDSWRVINDISLNEKGHNVDHLVIGPGGVFSLNAKNLSGRVWVAEQAFCVNGKPTDYLRKAQWEAREVTKRLAGSDVQFKVEPVIVVIADRDRIKIKAQPLNVAVVQWRDIRAWLESQPTGLTPDEVERLAAFA